jgi:hypothetical protein
MRLEHSALHAVQTETIVKTVHEVLDYLRDTTKLKRQRLSRQLVRSEIKCDARKKQQRHGHLYLHVCTWAKAIKIGYSLSTGSKRSGGSNTSTFWPDALVMRVPVDLGVCTEATARTRLLRYETLVRCCLQSFLVHKRREVRRSRTWKGGNGESR